MYVKINMTEDPWNVVEQKFRGTSQIDLGSRILLGVGVVGSILYLATKIEAVDRTLKTVSKNTED
jgi:hypothetical protein